MQVGVMKTDHGPHPADKWALATTGKLMQAVFGKDTAETVGQRKLEIELLDILMDHHSRVKANERGKIEEHGMERLFHPLDPREHCPAVVSEIVAEAKKIGNVEIADPDNPGKFKTVDLGAHFGKPEVQGELAKAIGGHFATSMDIERSWHADRNAGHPDAKAYHEARRNHGGALVHDAAHLYRKAPAQG
jgi:hypothetical protein